MRNILTILVVLLAFISIANLTTDTLLQADPWDVEPVDIPVPDPDLI